MGLVDFFVNNQVPLLFYTAVILVIILLRRHFEWQAFGIGLYKTKAGLGLMESWGKRHRGLVQLLGYIGVGIGFIGMGAIAYALLAGLWNMVADPAAPPVISPVIPGFSIPGFDLKVPLITGWLALFVVVVIHEFAHGVVSRAHDIKVKSSGLAIFGPIVGAFVEPDEGKLKKSPEVTQYSLFAAGPFSNILSAAIFALALIFVLAPLSVAMTTPAGVEITSVMDGYGAANASLAEGMVITAVNGVTVMTYDELTRELESVRPGDTVALGTGDGVFNVLTTTHPQDAQREQGYLGVNLKASREPKNPAGWYAALLAVVVWLQDFVNWIVILSLGIGLANLLPLGPLDGGRMLQTASRQITGNARRGDWWWKRISLATLVLILVLLFVPIIRSIV